MLAPTAFPTQNSLAQAPTPQEDMARKETMRKTWDAYRGIFPNPLKLKKGQTDDNVLSNRCAPIVDKGVSFLFGQPLKIQASDETTEDAPGSKTVSPLQDFIQGLWGDDDDKMTLLSNIAINGGVCGQPFVKLIPAQNDMKYPRIVVLDPLLIRIVTAPDDCSLHLAYIIEYPGYGDMQKRQIIARVDPDGLAEIEGEEELDDTWTITNYQRRGTSSRWVQVGTQEEWPYPFAPIFTCQNLPSPNESWGMSDLPPDLIGMNKALNFLQSNTSRIIKFHAHPQTWGKGFNASQMSRSVDEVLIIEAMDGTLQNLEMHSDLASSLKFAEVLRMSMDERSNVPAVALGRIETLPRGLSGIALQLLFQPLIEKTTHKRRIYGKLIREITRAALVLSGKIPVEAYEDFEITLQWGDLLPSDDVASAQTAILWGEVGASKQTLLARGGFDAEEEAQRKQKEDEQAVKNMSQGVGLPVAQAPLPGQQQQQQQGRQGQGQGVPQ